MSEQKKVGRIGRPTEHIEEHKRTTIELPSSLIEFLKTVKPNRTKWVIEAIQEKMEREQEQAKFFAMLHKKDGS